MMASHRLDHSPGQRFRFEQYIGFLRSNGFSVDFSHFIDEEDDKILYGKGRFLSKLQLFLKAWAIRSRDRRNFRHYDIVFVQREAWMLGSTYFEDGIRGSGARFIFDFDDSVWLLDTSAANKRWEWLKNPNKTSKLIGLADMVLAGNPYLADYARRFNDKVTVFPTTIDTEEYAPGERSTKTDSRPVVIGWSGSVTTIKHFQYASGFLLELKKKYGNRIAIHVIGDADFIDEGLEIKGRPWVKSTEISDLRRFDIGIMPLPNDEWAWGKCGLKGLQYMALGIPTIMSPVGVNTSIIQHGENGFLASKAGEWIDSLSRLVESVNLRNSIGVKARRTVVEKYSVSAQKANYLNLFRGVLASG